MQTLHGIRESFPWKNNPIAHAKEPGEGARLKQKLQCGTDEHIHLGSSGSPSTARLTALRSRDAAFGFWVSLSWKPCQGCCQVITSDNIPGSQRGKTQQTPQHRARSSQGRESKSQTSADALRCVKLTWPKAVPAGTSPPESTSQTFLRSPGYIPTVG